VNDKRWGGVFASRDGGLTWGQRADGLEGHDVFSLAEASNGTVVAGTERGLYVYDPGAQFWKENGEVASAHRQPGRSARGSSSERSRSGTRKAPAPDLSEPKPSNGKRIELGVSAIALVEDNLYAVTTDGVFTANDPAQSWHRVDGPTSEPWRYIAGAQSTIFLASLKSLTLSGDLGKSWHMVPLPAALTQIGAVAVDDSGVLWVGGREGIFVSTTNGASWEPLKDIFVPDVNDIFYDRRGRRLLVTSGSSTLVYSVHLPDRAIRAWDSGWNLRFVRPVGDYLIGATMFDGVVVQPRMVQSKEGASQ
jgi:photosystem II stability/assembly factor-like uncharacterized protein